MPSNSYVGDNDQDAKVSLTITLDTSLNFPRYGGFIQIYIP